MPIKLVKRPRSPNWVIRGTLREVRVEESTGTDDKRSPKKSARSARARSSSLDLRSCATASFAEAALNYLENGGSRRFPEPVIQHFRTTPLAKIDQAAIEPEPRETLSRCLAVDSQPAVLHSHGGGSQSRCQARAVQQAGHSQAETEAGNSSLAPTGRGRTADCGVLPSSSAPRDLHAVHWRRAGEALWLDWRCLDLARAT